MGIGGCHPNILSCGWRVAWKWVTEDLARGRALPGFLIRRSTAPDDDIDGNLSGEEAGGTVWTARRPRRISTHADQQFAPARCASGRPFAFVRHRIARPSGWREFVAISWKGASRAGLRAWGLPPYTLVALAKLPMALASSSWTSKTV